MWGSSMPEDKLNCVREIRRDQEKSGEIRRERDLSVSVSVSVAASALSFFKEGMI